ncbi:NAD-dependent epimerase/dehydratase family protein [Streptomyces fuscigenes]|uniref:NAD-dependent epimerase/dehydratase family protein n=1 Tax=Streptomyces fuscigenes TaxID=1528880 RepID=UPI001F3D06E6|nr:NAD-dependent epimerase/dehydratase family protein [Streptomyces fuscigenes]MCF3960172.1 NAD-dependent epimerase/dehydratase family protein [Streptomyces fuscigenes]
MRAWTVVLTGATGFIGSAVLRRLAGRTGPDGRPVRVRALSRGAVVAAPGGGTVEHVRADITEPGSLADAFRGADALVHAVSYVGADEERCAAVNLRGTGAVMAAARAAGIPRIVHVSTAAVYGAGPHRGIDVDGVEAAPVSPASRTRLAAEAPAAAAGALVLRPHLVLGAGDRWVVPALGELARRVPPEWLGGRGLQSLVDVGDLARLVGAAATARTPVRGLHHAAHPEPVSTGRLRAALSAHGLVAPARGSADWEECRALLARSRGRYGERQLELLALDHSYLSERVWDVLGTDPGPGPLARLDEAAAWYRNAAAAEVRERG